MLEVLPNDSRGSDEGLTFGKQGRSFCYLVKPLTYIKGPMDNFTEAFREASKRYEEMSRLGEKSTEGFKFDTYVMLGASDVLFDVHHNNFRFIHLLQNELTTLSNLRTSWFHALPYSSHCSPKEPPQGVDALLIQVFLRAGMHPYRDPDSTPLKFAEVLASKLYELISEANTYGFFLDMFTTIGWADCVLSGKFVGSAEDYDRLFNELEKIDYQIGSERVSFHRKRITLAGFPVTVDDEGKPSLPPYRDQARRFSPLLVARSLPGKMAQARRELEESILRLGSRDPGPLILSIDGKWDLLWQAGLETVPLQSIRDAVHHFATEEPEIAEGKGSDQERQYQRYDGFLERLETHLLAFPATDDLISEKTNAPPTLGDYRQEHRTNPLEPPYRHLERRINLAWDEVKKLRIAGPILNEISTHLSLSLSIIRDNDNRVMVDYMIHGAIDALLELVYHVKCLEGLIVRYQDNPPLQEDELQEYALRKRSADEHYSELQAYLRNWCKFVGKGIRQRVSGSFENLFDRALNAPAHRGTIQKMIFVMDGLLREFYGLLPPELTRIEVQSDYERPPRLASIFTPTTTISSQRYLELVEIPARYSFSPHQVLPQLWHEVGQCVFFRNFNPFKSPFHRQLKRIYPGWHNAAFHQLGDHFSDLLVLRFGFQDRFNFFSRSLVKSVFQSERELLMLDNGRINEERRNWLLQEIAGRLHVLKRYLDRVLPYGERVADDIVAVGRDLFDYLFPGPVADPWQNLPPYCHDELFDRALEHVFDPITRNVKSIDTGVREIDGFISPYDKIIDRISAGNLCDLLYCFCGELPLRCDCPGGILVNEIFLHYYERDLNSYRDEISRPSFEELAALGFTALQAFRGSEPAFERAAEIREKRLRSGNSG